MNFHLLGLPHTISNFDYITCAYTQKVIKLAAMLKSLGHTVYHYGVEGSICDATENVDVMPKSELEKHYPLDQQAFFTYDTKDNYHQSFYKKATREVFKRFEENDFILCMWGWGHEPIAKNFYEHKAIVVEPGIGFTDYFAPHKVFESYAVMHEAYGKKGQVIGGWNDTVIPNFFETDDFEISKPLDYGVYLGRMIENKGVKLVSELANATKTKIIAAGNGNLKDLGIKESEYFSYIGFVNKEQRKELLSKAKFLIAPSFYLEPFGGVMVEALMSGVPVITTDWGGFSENNIHGKTGYRCRSFADFVNAIDNINKINRAGCRKFAIEHFSTDVIKYKYNDYFTQIYNQFTSPQGWYLLPKRF